MKKSFTIFKVATCICFCLLMTTLISCRNDNDPFTNDATGTKRELNADPTISKDALLSGSHVKPMRTRAIEEEYEDSLYQEEKEELIEEIAE